MLAVILLIVVIGSWPLIIKHGVDLVNRRHKENIALLDDITDKLENET